MTSDTPTPPAATGSRAQETLDRLVRVLEICAQLLPTWAPDLDAAGKLIAGWTRRPSGAGCVKATDVMMDAGVRAANAHDFDAEGRVGYVQVRAVWDAMSALSLRGDAETEEIEAQERPSVLADRADRATTSSGAQDGPASSAPPPETDAPAAAEPQAGEPLPCPFCSAAMSKRRGPGIIGWDHPNGDCLFKGYCLTESGVAAWNARPTPATPAPASAPGVGGEGEINGPGVRVSWANALRPAPPRADAAADDVAALRKVLSDITKLRKSIEAEVRSAHSHRGNAAPDWMRDDDREFRNDLRAAFDKAEATLASAQRKEG